MRWLSRLTGAGGVRRSTLLEVAGLSLVTAGLREVYVPASLIFGGIALVFIAQGMERGE